MRAALVAMRDAYSATFARLFGYDWNADPDGVTLKQGDAWAQAEAALRTEPTRPRVFADLAAARAEAAEWKARYEALARQATAAGPVLEAAIRLDDADSECIAHHVMYPNDEDGEIELMVEYRAARRALTAAVAALRAAREGRSAT